MLRSAAVGLVVVALSLPAGAARGRDAVATAAASARSDFVAGLRDAEDTFAGAGSNIAAQLRAGAMTPGDAADGYSAALAFFTLQVKRRGDLASDALAQAVSDLMKTATDASLPGAIVGDGGSLDSFTSSVQASLDAARRRTLARAARFARTLERKTVRSRMSVVLPPWIFERRAAPTIDGPVPPRDGQLRLLAAIATRLDDGTVLVTLAGSAAKSVSGRFDAALYERTIGAYVGPKLSAGGVEVADDGTWSVAAAMNDPHNGENYDAGNRTIVFGVEPYDDGIFGLRASRFEHAGVLGIP
jgi:hypothetical protein